MKQWRSTRSRRASDWNLEEVGLLITPSSVLFFFYLITSLIPICPPGVDTDELDSNVDDWEEETIEFFINEEVIPFGDL